MSWRSEYSPTRDEIDRQRALMGSSRSTNLSKLSQSVMGKTLTGETRERPITPRRKSSLNAFMNRKRTNRSLLSPGKSPRTPTAQDRPESPYTPQTIKDSPFSPHSRLRSPMKTSTSLYHKKSLKSPYSPKRAVKDPKMCIHPVVNCICSSRTIEEKEVSFYERKILRCAYCNGILMVFEYKDNKVIVERIYDKQWVDLNKSIHIDSFTHIIKPHFPLNLDGIPIIS
ncbi:hypothetical protein PCE1_003901 [Barthelona sp. PCE]